MSAGGGAWPPTDVPVIDEEALDAIREVQDAGAPDLVAETAALFFDDTPRRIAELHQASAAGDATGLRRCSHSIKGSSWLLGLMRLGRACELLEADGAEGRVEHAPLWVGRIVVEYELASRALRGAVEAGAVGS